MCQIKIELYPKDPSIKPFGANYYAHDEPMCRMQWDWMMRQITDAMTRAAIRAGLLEYGPSREAWERANGFR